MATTMGTAIAQPSVSLSGNFAGKTVAIGKNINGDVTLVIEFYQGQPLAAGGITGTSGDTFPFNSRGGLVKGAGFWKGLSGSPYAIRLMSAQEITKDQPGPPVSQDQMLWVAYNSSGTTVQTRPDGTEIMPLILQTLNVEYELRGAAAILIVRGGVQWNANGRLIAGTNNLLQIKTSDGRTSPVTGSETSDDGALIVSTSEGTRYKIHTFSPNFSAAFEEIKDGREAAPAAPGATAASGPPGIGSAVLPSPLRVAGINFQGTVAQTNEGKRAFADLQQKYQPQIQELRALQGSIDDLTKELNAQNGSLSEADRADRTRILGEKKNELKRTAAADQAAFQKDAQEIFNTLASKVYDFVSAYAQKKGFAVVMNSSESRPSVLWLSAPYSARAGNLPNMTEDELATLTGIAKNELENPTDITNAAIAGFNVQSSVPAAAQSGSQNPTTGAAAAGSPKDVVRNYLLAASSSSPSASAPFVSRACTVDIVDEFKANRQSGWAFSIDDLSLTDETISPANDKASVTAVLIYKGGNPPTSMAAQHTFFLVREDGAWKIRGIDPPPAGHGPGVSPL